MSAKNFIYGISPIYESLRHQNRSHHQLLVKEKLKSPKISEIIQLANKNKIPIKFAKTEFLGNMAKTKTHQGLVLLCGDLKCWELDDLVEEIGRKSIKTLVALDQIEDPQNMGAIIRSAAYFGVDGIITLKKKAAPLSATVSKASAGTLESLKICQVTNLSESLIKLKKTGFYIIGATSGDSMDFKKLPLTNDIVLVMGNEGRGLRTLTEKRCDFLAHIPGQGTTDSLNVSAASAVLLQHLYSRQ